MSLSGQEPMRFSVGDALTLTFRELTRRFGHYAILVLLLSLPGLVVNLTMPIDPNFGATPPTPAEMAAFWPAVGLAMVVGVLAYALLIGSFTYSVVSGLRGQDLSLREALAAAFEKLHYVLATLIVVGVIVMLGFFLMIVPGVIAMLILFVAGSVAAAESAWPGESLSRSSFLTKGSRWSILGLLLVQILAGLILLLLLSVVAVSFLGANPETLTPNPESMLTYTIVSVIIGLPFNAFFAIMPVVVYFLLAVEKDGRDAGDMARVFD